MKKITLILSVFLFFIFAATPAHADGELQTVNQNGTLYLSTSEVKNTASTSGASLISPDATQTSAFNTLGTPISLPTGFAKDIGALFNFILQVIMVISLLLVFGFLIVGGLQWITSGGEKGKVDAARQRIIAAIIGLILVASSFAIFMLLLHFLGFSDINEAINHVEPLGNSAVQTTPPSTDSSQLRQQNLVQ